MAKRLARVELIPGATRYVYEIDCEREDGTPVIVLERVTVPDEQATEREEPH